MSAFTRCSIPALLIASMLGVLTPAAEAVQPALAAPATTVSSARDFVTVQSQHWFAWGYYSTYSGCAAAGKSYYDGETFIGWKCVPATYPNNGKYQLWLLEVL